MDNLVDNFSEAFNRDDSPCFSAECCATIRRTFYPNIAKSRSQKL